MVRIRNLTEVGSGINNSGSRTLENLKHLLYVRYCNNLRGKKFPSRKFSDGRGIGNCLCGFAAVNISLFASVNSISCCIWRRVHSCFADIYVSEFHIFIFLLMMKNYEG
jgi:hypothetical protein